MVSETSLPILELIVALTVGLSSSFGLYWYQKRERRRRLRKSFLAEIEAMADGVHGLAEMGSNIFDPEAEFPSDGLPIPETDPVVLTAYQSNSSDIGILTEPEVELLTEFYTHAELLKRQINDLHRRRGDAQAFASAYSRSLKANNSMVDCHSKLCKELGRTDNVAEPIKKVEPEKSPMERLFDQQSGSYDRMSRENI